MTREEHRPGERGRDRGTLAIIALVLVVCVAFFWPATFGGRFAILHDSWCWSFPLRSAAWQSIRAGQLPLWTSGIFSGYPLFSISQLGLAYPLTWFYAFSDAWGEQIYVLAPFVLAPLFTYVYVRELRLGRAAALLAGLSFTYGGFVASPIGHNGLMSNGFMWLPLALAAVERSRHGSFVACLVAGSFAFGAAVISGVGQGFVNVALVVGAYGVFAGLLSRSPLGFGAWERWRPTAVALGSLALGAALGAFQIFETMQANRLSARKSLTYQVFTEGSAPISNVLISVLDPLHQTIGDVTSFVPALALLLVVVAMVATFRRGAKREPAVLFWLGAALVSLLLMFGPSTPFYRLAYWTPFLNLFRIPPRHSAEWTFALGVLAAYGWEAASAWVAERRAPGSETHRQWLAIVLFVAAIGLTFAWNAIPGQEERTRFLLLKGVSTLCIAGALYAAWTLTSSRSKLPLAYGLLVLATVSEGYICVSRWWFPWFKSAEYLAQVSPITEWLRRSSGRDGRVYTHIIGFGEESRSVRPVDAPNTTARFGLQEAAGYDPMIFTRYSEALGDAGMFAVPPSWDPIPNSSYGGPFNLRSHVLDLLNVRYVVRRLRPSEQVLPPSWERGAAPDRLVLDVGDPAARNVMVSGFSGDEELGGHTGCWTDGTQSKIRAFLLPTRARYEARLIAMAFHAAAPLDVTLRINGKKAGVFHVGRDWGERSIKLPRELPVEGWNDIAFVYSKTVTPASIDPKTSDRRKLAMFLDFVSLTPVQ